MVKGNGSTMRVQVSWVADNRQHVKDPAVNAER